MPPVAGAITVALINVGVSAGIAIFLGQAAVSAAFLLASTALSPKPKTGGISTSGLAQGRQDSVRQANAPRRTVYGEQLVGGTLMYAESFGSAGQNLSLVTAFASHEIQAFDQYWFGDQLLTLSGNDVQGAYLNPFSPGQTLANIYSYTGTSGQLADATLVAASGGLWTSDHRLSGIAYTHTRLAYLQSAFADFRIEGLRVRLRGKTIYDPRVSSTLYNANAALVLRDYLVNRVGIDEGDIDDTSVTAAANICDEQVALVDTSDTFTAATDDVLTLATGLVGMERGNVVRFTTTGTLPAGLSLATDYYWIPTGPKSGKVATSLANSLTASAVDITDTGTGVHTVTLKSELRYTCHATIDDAVSPVEAIRAILASMAGALTYSGGVWRIYAGAAVTATITLDEDDLRGPITVNPRRSRSSLFNAIKGVYTDPDKAWQATTCAAVLNSTYETDDGGDRIWKNVDLPFTTSSARAQRLAKIELERNRQQITVTYPCNLTALRLNVWDTVNITNSRFGWSAKKFRVVGLRIAEDNGVDLTLAEEADEMWDWSQEATLSDFAPDTNLPDPNTVNPVPLISFAEELRVTASGGVVTVVIVTLTESPGGMADRYEVQFMGPSDTDWRSAGSGPGTVFEISPLTDGDAYQVRARAINALGVASTWRTQSYTPAGQTTPPANVGNFAVNIVQTTAHLTWDAVADVDLSHYRIRWAPATTGATWGSAIDLVPRVARPATSVQVAALIGTYLIKAVDLKGNESTTATATISTIAGIADLNVVQTVTESPTFTGAKSNVAVAGSSLVLDTAITFDDATGDFDDALGLFDSGGGEVATAGTYTFANGVDLGAVYTSRVTASLTVSAQDYVNQFDDAEGNFDDRPGLFDGESPSNVNVSLEVRTTADDPSGSPSWGDWRAFTVGDYTCRAFQFRAQLSTDVATQTPVVSALSVTVDMPDRVAAGSGVTSNSGDTNVTYLPAFKATPKVGVTVLDIATGEYATVTSESASGFTINVYTAAASRVARNFNYLAKGYGVAA
jgi:hypothetical protein